MKKEMVRATSTISRRWGKLINEVKKDRILWGTSK